MKNWRLKYRILLLALGPVWGISVLLTLVVVVAGTLEIDGALKARGVILTRQLASASEYGAFSGNHEVLQDLIDAVLKEDDAMAASVRSADNGGMAYGGKPSVLSVTQAAAARAGEIVLGERGSLIFGAAIRQGKSGNDNFDLLSQETDTKPLAPKVLGFVYLELSTAASERTKNAFILISIMIGLFGTVIASALALQMSRSIAAPLSRLLGGVNLMAQGKLDTRIAANSGGELAELEQGFNLMASKLQDGRDSMLEVNLNLERLVADRTLELQSAMQRAEEANQRLSDQKDVAESATLAKSRFLAAASHDLRQPIHAQGLFLEVLAHSELSVSQRELLASVRSAATASAEMLDALLDFSRIEAGVIEANPRPFHLQPLLNKIENDLAPQANAKDLVYRSRDTVAAVHSDPALVDLIVRNLMSNAIRYTEDGGVLLGCRRRGHHIVVEVWDTGIGIDPDQHQEIFREFHQLGNPERDRRKGLGLGLAIAGGLAKTLGHDLSLRSTPGRGSVFRLALPIADVALVKDEPFDGAQPLAGRLHARVLVVDDEDAVRAGMLHLLRDWGCEVDAVESIEDALASARAHRPDMILCDYRLREQRNGAQAIAALRAQCGAEIAALLITGDTAPDRLSEANASGIPLLHKPVSPRLLYRRMEEILGNVEMANGDKH